MKLLPLSLLLCACTALADDNADLAKGFQKMPDSARPMTWWHWMNGNISKEGIKADLEDMKRVGLAGAQIFNVATREPVGPAPFGSPQWEDCVKYAMKTAKDLGLEITIMNGPGWSNSGGPWVTPEQSMKTVVWSETPAGGNVVCTLKQPETKKDFYRDICVLAVPPDPLTEGGTAPTSSTAGTPGVWADQKPGSSTPWTFDFAYPQATERASLVLSVSAPKEAKFVGVRGEVQASQDGTTFTTLHHFDLGGRTPWAPVTIAFPRTTAKTFRLVVYVALPQAMPPKSVTAQISAAERTENFVGKTVATTVASVTPLAPSPSDPAGAIPESQVIDVSSRMKPDGSFQWNAPAGKWTILRMGYTTTGMLNHPAGPFGTGLEVDKFSRPAIRQFLDQSLDRFMPKEGRLFDGILDDSWEVGEQNWTADFPEKFQQRRGYDLHSFLPALTGRVVSSPAETEAFLTDFRQTICDLVANEYYGGITEFARQKGLKFYGEAYDGYCFNEQEATMQVDKPMTEFWSRNGDVRTPEFSSVVHIMGQQVLSGESFTGATDKGKWIANLSMLKQPGDSALANGLNRMIFHSYVQQPSLDLWPGFSLLFYGVNFGRWNPWWKEAGAWVDYIARCQFLLQHGRNEADFLLLRSADVDMLVNNEFPSLPAGFAGDQLIPLQLLALQAADGKVTLSNGASYRAVVLPKAWVASTDLLKHLEGFVKAGVTVTGPPPVAPNNLKDQRALSEWTAVVNRLWPNGAPGDEPATAAKKAKWTPDCLFTFDKGGAKIAWCHRVDGTRDIYFVANSDVAPVTGSLKLRAGGRQPELWDALTGKMSAAPVFRENGDGTEINLSLAGLQSVLIVLQKPLPSAWTTNIAGPTGDPVPLQNQAVSDGSLWTAQSGTYTLTSNAGKTSAVTLKVPETVTTTGPWNVHFQPPVRKGFEKTFDQLGLWNNQPDNDVKYFAGTGTYRKEVTVPADALGKNVRATLNLGEVWDIASVTVNGVKAGTVWVAPFSLDVTSLLKPGKNQIEIAVSNRPVNRLIGDEQLPDDVGYNGSQAFTVYPAWYTDPAKIAARQRATFTALRSYTKDAPLVPAGLAGPVTLSFQSKIN